MPKSLLAVALVASACWAAPSRQPETFSPPERPRAPSPATPSLEDGRCHERGERLLLATCRRGHDLTWKVTNLTDATLLVFVAPPAIDAGPRRDNAYLSISGGQVLLRKIQLLHGLDDYYPSGAVTLAPGASDGGVVTLGARLDPKARHFYGEPRGQRITSVVLEVGFTVKRPRDQLVPLRDLVMLFDRDPTRYELVRSPELSWL